MAPATTFQLQFLVTYIFHTIKYQYKIIKIFEGPKLAALGPDKYHMALLAGFFLKKEKYKKKKKLYLTTQDTQI